MRKLFFLCLVLIAISAIGSCTPKKKMILHDAANHEISLDSLKGKWIILSYWAEWCDSCKAEVPKLNEFYYQNHNKNIVLLGVNDDELLANNLQKAIKKMGIQYPVLVEKPALFWQIDEISVLPALFIISPEGKVIKKIIGLTTVKELTKILFSLENAR